MTDALYGEAGFFVRGTDSDADDASVRSPTTEHFRTSAHASPLFATAVLRLIAAVDEGLDRPDPFQVVDVGAGTGDLVRRVAVLAPTYLRRRLHLRVVELAHPPADLPEYITWTDQLPEAGAVTGVLLATEWLDNVPLDIAEVDAAGIMRYALVDPMTGDESAGDPVSDEDARWAARWWSEPWPEGTRVELGATRDAAWADAVGALARGLAFTVDYGHHWRARPPAGTLAGFRAGREVAPVPDGSCDLTAHVAFDAICAAGENAAGRRAFTLSQADGLHALGLDGARPPRSLASQDPTGYVRALSAATQAAELMDPAGLGAHRWLLQPVGLASSVLPAGLRP